MRYNFFLLCVLFVSKMCAQESTVVYSWNKLSSALVKRAEAFVHISLTVSKVIPVDSILIDDIIKGKLCMLELTERVDYLDSNFVQRVNSSNRRLVGSFSKLLILIVSNPKFSSKVEVSKIQVELMSAENIILIAKRRYNETVKKNGRLDLLYD